MGRMPSMDALDGLELVRRLVALQLGAAGAHAVEGDAGRHVEEERQVGPRREAVGGDDELVRDAGALVGEGAQGVAIDDHVLAARQTRRDLRVEVIEPVGGEEQRHHLLVDDAELAVGLRGGGAAGEDLADELAHRAVAGLVRQVDAAALLLQALGEHLRLRGGAGAVQALEDDEASGRGHGSIPSSARSSRTRASSFSSRRRSVRACK